MKIHSYTTRQIETDEGDMLDLPYSDPFDNSIIEDTLIIKNAGAETPTFGGYLIHDEYAYDSYSLEDMGIELRPVTDDDWAEGDHEFLVSELDYRHTVEYVLTEHAPSATHIISIPDDVDTTHAQEYAQGVLSEYSSVCSGDSYSIVIAAWDHEGRETNSSVVGGYHGLKYALAELASDMKAENEDIYR